MSIQSGAPVAEGQKYGKLLVTGTAGQDAGGKALFWCKCDCGSPRKKVRGTKLKSGREVSCGCTKKDAEVRRNARNVTTPERRAEIAKMGADALRKKEQGDTTTS